jgi:RNA polymerase sigma factor (sigma-70 family)
MKEAHQGSDTIAGLARNRLVLRYGKAVRSYLGGMLKNDPDADDVANEIMVKMLEGKFGAATSARGRFRDYLKAAVRNAALNFLRRKHPARRVELDTEELSGSRDDEQAWLGDWRRCLLERTQQALKSFQDTHPGNIYATLLDFLSAYPQDDSEQLAQRLQELTGQKFRADAVRKQISRARRKFAELLLEEVKRTLDDPTTQRIEEELIEVGLMPYVRDFLPRDWKA